MMNSEAHLEDNVLQFYGEVLYLRSSSTIRPNYIFQFVTYTLKKKRK